MASTALPESGSRLPAGDKPLSLGLSLGFGVGTIGVSIMLNTVTTYFPAMMSTVLGQSTAIAGVLLTLSKLYDILADILIGTLSDRSQSKLGRRRPFLAIGGIVSAASFMMIFMPPVLGDTALIAYMAVALILYSTGYSLFNVPYLAIPADISDDPHVRAGLFSFRTAFVAVGQLIALGGAAALIAQGGGDAGGYRTMGMVLAAAILAAMLGCFFGTASARWAPPRPRDQARVPFRQTVRMLWETKPLVWLISAKILQYLSLASGISTNLLFKLNVLQIGYSGQAQFSVVSNVFTALSMPVWLRLARHYGKKRCYMAATFLYACSTLVWLFTGSGISNPTLWAIGAAMGAFSGGMILLGLAMLSDTMAYDRARTGLRREGLFSSVYAIVEKGAFAIGALLVGWALSLAGYVPTTGGRLTDQPANAIISLYATNTVVPAFFLLLSIFAISRYQIDDRKTAVGAASRS
ncbi:MFS transporter [Polymorphobacter sp.]|uniref:MFS transporter n=1 Tax=Polymorphobacter sp. TaxID=1909290 RepID=UPI003F70FD56